MKSWLMAAACMFALTCIPAQAAQVTVEGAWVRSMVPGQTVGGAYFKIESAATAYLVGASSPVAKAVELHQMSLENNVMKMRPVARLELTAGKPVELKPGGYHLMMIDVKHPIVAGERVPLKLTIEDSAGRRQTVDVTAEAGDGPAAMQHGAK